VTASSIPRCLVPSLFVLAVLLAGCQREPANPTPGPDEGAAVKPEGVSPERGEDLAALWDDLAADAPRAYRAIAGLTQRPGESVPFLKARLRPAADPDAAEVARLIAALDAEDFAEREQAHRGLEVVSELATPALKHALEDEPSPEARRRLTGVLERAEKHILSRETLRAVRAVEALERIGTPEAREVLAELAKGVPASWLTQEARAALDQLDRRRSQ
jgi:hypothetical protein